MAPEQTQPTAAGISTRTDVYLLGGMLYQILTGCVPRRAPKARETIKLAAEGIIVPVDHAAPLRYHPPELVRITLRALDPQPNRRYPSVLIMQEEIRRYLSGASNRTEAETIVQTVRAGLDTLNTRLKARESVPVPQLYSICAQALSDLGRAEVLWPKINTVGPLRRQVLNTYAGTALEQGDLMLARGLSALMEQGEDRDLVTHGIARWEQDKAHQRIQRRLMAYALVALLILLIGGSAFYLEGQKQARLGLAVERDAADNARRAAARMQDTAEREQYFSSIAGADASIEKLRGDTAARLLLNSTKPELRTWEWGLLIRRVLGDQFSLKPLNFVLGSTWAPNNTHLYAGTRDGSLNIWDATTGRYQSIWKYFVGRLYEINPSPDNTRLLLTSFDHYALIVQARDGRIIHRLFGHQGILRGGAWEQTGRFVLTTSFDKTAALWNANSGQLVRRYIGFAKAVNGGAFGPGGSTVLLYSDDGTAALLDTLSGIRLITYSGPGPAIQDARFSQDYRRVITASQDGFLRIYDTESTQPLRAVRMPDSFPNTVCFVRGSRFVATVLENGDGSILDMETGEVLTRFLGEGLPRQIQTSPNGKVLTVAGRFAVRSYDLQRLLPDTDRMDPEHWDLARNHADVRLRVYGLTPGRDPTWEQLERAWNVPGGLTILRQEKRTVAVESRYSVFSPHGRWRFDLDPTTLQGAVIQTKPTTSVLYRTPSRVRIPYGQFSPDSQWLATLNPLDKVALIRTTDWRVAKTLSRQPANPSQPQSAGLESYTASEMAFSPDSRSIAVAYLNGRVAVFDVETGQLRYETPAIQGIGAGVTFDADGQWLITPSNDDRIYVWNAQTGQLDRTMIGHTRPVMGVALSPNKLRMASFARDRTVRLWDFPSGRELMTVVKTPDGKLPVGAGFTPDGLALIVIISDGTIQVHEAMPWREEDYPGGPQDPTLPPNIAPLTLAQRIELYNRRKLLGPHVTIDDLLHIPTYPTANYTSGTLPINP
jgi:WD40 repeat protein